MHSQSSYTGARYGGKWPSSYLALLISKMPGTGEIALNRDPTFGENLGCFGSDHRLYASNEHEFQ